MKWKCAATVFLLSLGTFAYASANKLNHVYVVDDLTLEVEMDEPLTEEEIHPADLLSPDYQSPFSINEGVTVTGPPIPQKFDGFHDNVYRIAVDGLEEGPIYQISYRGQKPKTFKLYGGKETTDRYRDRYGDYF